MIFTAVTGDCEDLQQVPFMALVFRELIILATVNEQLLSNFCFAKWSEQPTTRTSHLTLLDAAQPIAIKMLNSPTADKMSL